MGKKERVPATKYQVTLSENAIENIDELIDYIAIKNQQPLNSIRVGEAIFERILLIGITPFQFKECELIPTQSKMYRQTLCLSWYIIYKVISAQIIILGVIHKSQKPSKRSGLRKNN